MTTAKPQRQLSEHDLRNGALPVNVELMNIRTTRVLSGGRFSRHPARTRLSWSDVSDGASSRLTTPSLHVDADADMTAMSECLSDLLDALRVDTARRLQAATAATARPLLGGATDFNKAFHIQMSRFVTRQLAPSPARRHGHCFFW